MATSKFLSFISSLVGNPAVLPVPAGPAAQQSTKQTFGALNMLEQTLKSAEPGFLTWLDAHVDQHVGPLAPVVEPVVNQVVEGAADVAEGEAQPLVAQIEEAIAQRFGNSALDKLDQVLEAVTAPGPDNSAVIDKLEQILTAVKTPAPVVDPNLETADANAAAAQAAAQSVGASGKGAKTS